MEIRTIIVIGASTGGPQTLSLVIARLPVLDASVLIVQHMPKYINESIVRRLAELSRMKVKLGENGEWLENGTIYVAPSDVHMKLQNNRTIELAAGEKINYVRPAIDVTMKSIQRSSGINTIGVVLTGMGSDGTKGIRHIKSLGGATIAQNEDSCVIYGMPKAAVSTGMVDFILSPEEIGDKITELVNCPISALA
ncbi:MAG: CheB methylesterase domain-containing protein [Dehalococcoidia bacterium]